MLESKRVDLVQVDPVQDEQEHNEDLRPSELKSSQQMKIQYIFVDCKYQFKEYLNIIISESGSNT